MHSARLSRVLSIIVQYLSSPMTPWTVTASRQYFIFWNTPRKIEESQRRFWSLFARNCHVVCFPLSADTCSMWVQEDTFGDVQCAYSVAYAGIYLVVLIVNNDAVVLACTGFVTLLQRLQRYRQIARTAACRLHHHGVCTRGWPAQAFTEEGYAPRVEISYSDCQRGTYLDLQLRLRIIFFLSRIKYRKWRTPCFYHVLREWFRQHNILSDG